MTKAIAIVIVIVLALIALVAFGLPFLGGSGCGQTSQISTQIELSQLADAVDRYRQKTGELFPRTDASAHIAHIQTAFPYATEIEGCFNRSGFDLGSLDDSEALVLYLSGNVEDILGRKGYPEFEFDASRLTDIDKDGFHEFSSAATQTYRFDGVRPLVY